MSKIIYFFIFIFFRIFSTSVNNERYNMTPKNLDKPFSIYPNSNNLNLYSSISNLNYKQNLSLHTINENSNQNQEMYRIVLDDVNIFLIIFI